jgi:hypothetical protein
MKCLDIKLGVAGTFSEGARAQTRRVAQMGDRRILWEQQLSIMLILEQTKKSTLFNNN